MHIEKTIKENQTLGGMAEMIPDVEFSHAGGERLKMQIITPWYDCESMERPTYPLVVFVQGCAWTFPDVWCQIPQLSELARRGYVVATITHRNAMEGHPFPACLEDVKTAIRFLRKNANLYGINPERVGLWGTSSGGNLSLLTAMTIGVKDYETKEYPGYSDKVDYVVACFPTNDFVEYMQDETGDQEIKDIFAALSDGKIDENMSVLKKMSPYYLVEEAKQQNDCVKYPPVFLAHGDRDMLVPYRQTEKLYHSLKETDTDVTFVTVENAPHEGSFWGREMLKLIFQFIEEHC